MSYFANLFPLSLRVFAKQKRSKMSEATAKPSFQGNLSHALREPSLRWFWTSEAKSIANG
ncbi:hypothetical protein [Campylobacter sp. CS_ED2]|uniref:hypothetical protein n=1 Tax=Campylobacter sp. CS_ED2 TaxID=2984141 RepID=UPI0022E9B7C1|nr:hypothetical protein [Campylobacter sp. CS_ED2]